MKGSTVTRSTGRASAANQEPLSSSDGFWNGDTTGTAEALLLFGQDCSECGICERGLICRNGSDMAACNRLFAISRSDSGSRRV